MPVYNAGSFLAEAITSIQNQTYNNWELICVDDASTDNSLTILKSLQKTDNRIRVFSKNKNEGVSSAANLAISKAQGSFLARMDADDVACPTRLEKQVSYLIKNPEVVAVGGQCDVIDREGNVIGDKLFSTDPNEVYKMMFVKIPVQQPTIMINLQRLPKDFIWYNNKFTTAEEVELMFKLFKYGKVSNLSSKVLKYRIHGANVSLINPKKTFFGTLRSRLRAVKKYGYKPTLTGVAVTLIQFVIVTILPNKWIYPVYAFIRGMKKYTHAVISKPQFIKVRLASFFA